MNIAVGSNVIVVNTHQSDSEGFCCCIVGLQPSLCIDNKGFIENSFVVFVPGVNFINLCKHVFHHRMFEAAH